MKKITSSLLIIFCLLVSCISCNKKMMKEKPANLIPWDSMVVILADGCIAESSLFFAPRQYDKRTLSHYAYQELFEKHHITRDQYINSVEYYLSNEEIARKLLEETEQKVIEMANTLPPDTTQRKDLKLNIY